MTVMISSHANEMIKAVRKLRDKKFRNLTQTAFIEGTKLVIDALDQEVRFENIIISESFKSSLKMDEVNKHIRGQSTEIVVVSDSVFSSIAFKENPQGIGAVVKQRWQKLNDIENRLYGVWVGLVDIADPGNLGTIIRTADSAGAKGVFLIGNCVDPYDPGAIRASMGALFAIDLIKAQHVEFLNWANDANLRIIGTSDSAITHYRNYSYSPDLILLMGSEREGLSADIMKICEENVRIPMQGVSDSLNLAVATGIILFEISNQLDLNTGKR